MAESRDPGIPLPVIAPAAAQAVTETKSLDHDKPAKYIHATEIAYTPHGDWTQPRIVFTQFQDVQPNNVEQFRDGSKQPILWPPQTRTAR